MKFLDYNGLKVLWEHILQLFNNYLPLSGGTLSGDVRFMPNNTLSIMRNEAGASGDIVKLGWVSAVEKGEGIFIRKVSDGSNHLSINYRGICNNVNDADYVYTTDGNFRTLKSINGQSLFDDGNIDLDARYVSLSGGPYLPISGGTLTGELEVPNELLVGRSIQITEQGGIKIMGIGNEKGNDHTKAALYVDVANSNVDALGFATTGRIYVYGDADIDGTISTNSDVYATGSITSEANIISEGDITARSNVTAMAFYESSDITLKENVASISDEAVKVAEKIEAKQFNFKGNDIVKYGVIAQDVESVGLDNLVMTDENGKKSVDYISLLMLKIEALERRVAELEAERRA